MNKQVTKIKVGDRIEYERSRPDRLPERCEIDFVEAARPNFYDALDSLVPHLIKHCHLGDEWNTAKVAELNLRHLTNNQISISFTLEGSAETKDEVVCRSRIPGDYVDAVLQVKLVDVCREAELYIDGDRKQLNLFVRQEEVANVV